MSFMKPKMPKMPKPPPPAEPPPKVEGPSEEAKAIQKAGDEVRRKSQGRASTILSDYSKIDEEEEASSKKRTILGR